MKDSVTLIYGAGDYGHRLYAYFRENNISVNYFVQTFIDGTGHRVMDLPLISFSELTVIKAVCRIYIAIANKNDSKMIKEDLMDIGFDDTYIYECGEFIKQNLTDRKCKPITYNNHPYEVDMAQTYWKEYFDNKTVLIDSIHDLTDGLDESDCSQIDFIIKRMNELPFETIENDIFTRHEKQLIRRFERDFIPQNVGGSGVARLAHSTTIFHGAACLLL